MLISSEREFNNNNQPTLNISELKPQKLKHTRSGVFFTPKRFFFFNGYRCLWVFLVGLEMQWTHSYNTGQILVQMCILHCFSELCLSGFPKRLLGDLKRVRSKQMILWVFRGVYCVLHASLRCLWKLAFFPPACHCPAPSPPSLPPSPCFPLATSGSSRTVRFQKITTLAILFIIHCLRSID